MGAIDRSHRRLRGPRANGRFRRRGLVALLVGSTGLVLLAGGVPAGARVDVPKGGGAKRADAVKHAGRVVRAKVASRARAGGPGRALIANDLGRRVREQANLRQIDLSCFASFQFDFAPKLDNNTVTAQTTAALSGCVSPTGRHGDLLSSVLFADRGHSTATGCSPLPILVEGVGSILWNDESTSDFTFRVNTNPLADSFGLEAQITGGTLAGSRISAVPLLILQDGVCGLGGVNSLAINFGFDVFTHRPPLAS